MLQRLGKLARALLFGVKQPHVFDGDHGLVGEGLQQLNLSVGKRCGFSFGGCKGTNGYSRAGAELQARPAIPQLALIRANTPGPRVRRERERFCGPR